jgi:hypothetical protein
MEYIYIITIIIIVLLFYIYYNSCKPCKKIKKTKDEEDLICDDEWVLEDEIEKYTEELDNYVNSL